MRGILNETFYKQFCAGTTAEQVAATCAELRQQGYSGVILEYALEVLKDAEGTDEAQDVATWRKGMLTSVAYAAEGDFLGLKWSGMGPAALRRMAKQEHPSPAMREAMHAVAKASREKNIALLPAAEETWNLDGFQKWTIDMQREFNTSGKSVVYTTYQMYLKDMPGRIAKHLEVAKAEGFTLGAKLVRGAYLATEKRSLIQDTIEDTHAAYDAATEALIRRQYTDFLKPTSPQSSTLPDINVVVASHNAATVQKAQTLRRAQAARGEGLTPLVFAQLQGMADEVSCSLLAAAKAQEGDANAVKEKVFKCTTWGTMYECLNYLLRRAAENKDAAGRTWETRNAMQAELGRRMKRSLGLGA